MALVLWLVVTTYWGNVLFLILSQNLSRSNHVYDLGFRLCFALIDDLFLQNPNRLTETEKNKKRAAKSKFFSDLSKGEIDSEVFIPMKM